MMSSRSIAVAVGIQSMSMTDRAKCRIRSGNVGSVSAFLAVAVFGFALAVPAFAQVPIATLSAKLTWQQTAPDIATASGYTYRHYDDGSATGTAFAGVTCTGAASPFTCSVAFPAFTPGVHTLAITSGNSVGESVPVPMPALAFTFVVIPAAPVNVQILPTTTITPK